MEIVFDIQVDDNGNATVTQTNGQPGPGLKFIFKSSGPRGGGTHIKFADGSPRELKPGVPQKVPCSIDVLDPPGTKKSRHFDCGHMNPPGSTRKEDFHPWGAPRGIRRGGGDTPPIGGGNGN